MVQNDPFSWKNEWCEANNLVLYSFFLTDYIDLLGATQEHKSAE